MHKKNLLLMPQKFLLRKNLSTHMRRFHEEPKDTVDRDDDGGGDGRGEVRGDHHRRHPCSFCHRTFLYDSDRREHENTHTGERTHACQRCQRSYSSAKALAFHQKHTHGQEVYKCDVSSTYCKGETCTWYAPPSRLNFAGVRQNSQQPLQAEVPHEGPQRREELPVRCLRDQLQDQGRPHQAHAQVSRQPSNTAAANKVQSRGNRSERFDGNQRLKPH